MRNKNSGVAAGSWLVALSVVVLALSPALAYERTAIDACVAKGGSFDFQFGRCDTQRAHPGSSSTCLQNLPGRWRVVGNLAPGISALTPVEAKAWGGSVLSLQPDRVEFRQNQCANPSFQTREISADDFAENFRSLPNALGLTGADVCITEISCHGVWNQPGSVLIHGRGRLLAFWDGVFFDLRRE